METPSTDVQRAETSAMLGKLGPRLSFIVMATMLAIFVGRSEVQAAVVISQPAPLFSTNTMTGTFTLADSVTPGASFGAARVIATMLNFDGIVSDLAAINADVEPAQIFGMRSADGLSLSMLDFRFGFAATTLGCSSACAGQIMIDSGFGPSNFIAIDDLDGSTLSVIERKIALVIGAGLGLGRAFAETLAGRTQFVPA